MNAPPVNALEGALRRAALEPAQRPAFYHLLLESTVYVLGKPGAQTPRRTTVSAGERVSLQHWQKEDGTPVVPFFTSLDALGRAIEQETNWLGLPARALFEMTRGMALVLNPKSPYGKEFHPQETETLLATGVNRMGEQLVVDEARQILLGQPSEPPTALIEALTAFFAQRKEVKAAYLAMMHDPATDKSPHLLVGIEAQGDIDALFRDAGVVAGDTQPQGGLVDLFRVQSQQPGISDYLRREVKPFYERRWGSRFKALFGGGRA